VEAEKSKILNVVLGAIVKGNKLLLIKRNKEPFAEHWGMAGGKIEFGEDYDKAIVRELEEETGLKVNFESLRGIVEEFISADKKRTAHFYLFICATKLRGGKIKESNEGKLRWFTLREIINNKEIIIPSDYVMIQEFFGNKKRAVSIHKSYLIKDATRYQLEFFGL
jgi:mutator protein MutT